MLEARADEWENGKNAGGVDEGYGMTGMSVIPNGLDEATVTFALRLIHSEAEKIEHLLRAITDSRVDQVSIEVALRDLGEIVRRVEDVERELGL